MVVTATKRFTFDACHFLPGHKGKCANMHGHTYKLEVTIMREGGKVQPADSGSDAGMVMDFSDLKKLVNEAVIERFDHHNLNDVLTYRPTAENMAEDILVTLNNMMANLPVEVIMVKLWETGDSYVEVKL